MFAVRVERSGQDHRAVGRSTTFQRYFIQGYGQIYVKGKDSTESNGMNAIWQRLKVLNQRQNLRETLHLLLQRTHQWYS